MVGGKVPCGRRSCYGSLMREERIIVKVVYAGGRGLAYLLIANQVFLLN